jgi:hypothetical protein
LVHSSVGLLLLGLLTEGCPCPAAPESVNGFANGQTVQTTIVAPLPQISMDGYYSAASCGSLGDLPPGAVVTWKADVVVDPIAVGGCPGATFSAEPQGLSTGALTPGSPPLAGTANVTLPSGCAGTFSIQFYGPSLTSFLGSGATDAGVDWFMVRWFQLSVPSGSQCPVMAASGVACADAFSVTNVIIPDAGP